MMRGLMQDVPLTVDRLLTHAATCPVRISSVTSRPSTLMRKSSGDAATSSTAALVLAMIAAVSSLASPASRHDTVIALYIAPVSR